MWPFFQARFIQGRSQAQRGSMALQTRMVRIWFLSASAEGDNGIAGSMGELLEILGISATLGWTKIVGLTEELRMGS